MLNALPAVLRNAISFLALGRHKHGENPVQVRMLQNQRSSAVRCLAHVNRRLSENNNLVINSNFLQGVFFAERRR